MPDDATFPPPDDLAREEDTLAPYAMRTRLSRGRRHAEEHHAFRTPYQRDRDRIVHSTAFRRLMYKTQVLVTQTNDHHRTRLTHTLEVAQISRTIARQLGLNEDLTEAIALAHDLGHPPFGHAGEQTLNECMKGHGGFEHNHHGLRIVELLEYRYPSFPGLNLSLEVLEAQALHSKKHDAPEIQEFRALGQPLLEAQVVDAADSLAYDAHDVDDALSVGIITREELDGVPFWQLAVQRVLRKYPSVGPLQFQPAAIRALIDWQVTDLLAHTRQRLQTNRIRAIGDVRSCSHILVDAGPEVKGLKSNLESFLHERVYRNHRVMRMTMKGQRMVRAMFTEFCRVPGLLPERYKLRVERESAERVVCDYVAGMTDRFAQDEYLRLFQPYTPV
jgi:dGTPase